MDSEAKSIEEVRNQLQDRLEDVTEQKHERAGKGDDVGMAYRAGKEMAFIYAIEQLEEVR